MRNKKQRLTKINQGRNKPVNMKKNKPVMNTKKNKLLENRKKYNQISDST